MSSPVSVTRPPDDSEAVPESDDERWLADLRWAAAAMVAGAGLVISLLSSFPPANRRGFTHFVHYMAVPFIGLGVAASLPWTFRVISRAVRGAEQFGRVGGVLLVVLFLGAWGTAVYRTSPEEDKKAFRQAVSFGTLRPQRPSMPTATDPAPAVETALLESPFTAIENVLAEGAAEIHRVEGELAKALDRIAALESTLRQQNRPPDAAQPPTATRPSGQFAVTSVLPGVGGCGHIGRSADRLSSGEPGFLATAPARKKEFDEILSRMVAAARGQVENPESVSTNASAMRAWTGMIETSVGGTFGTPALLDLQGTLPSDELLVGPLAKEQFNEDSREAIRRATRALFCLNGIVTNLEARPKPQ